VNQDQVEEILSSRVRLRISDALSLRPRPLGELAHITGISVQGVLRHLRRLEKLGMVEERRVSANAPKVRIVYAMKDALLGDFSVGDMTIAKAVERRHLKVPTKTAGGLEGMAAEVLIQRRRVREEAKKLGRMIDQAAESLDELEGAIGIRSLSEDERLILEVILTEETVEDGVRVLSRFYGIEDRRSIDNALAKAKRDVGK